MKKEKSMRSVLISIALTILAACTGQNVDQSVKLGSSSGIMVTNLTCGPDVFWFEIYPSGVYSDGYTGAFNRAAVVTCDDDNPLKTINLAAGGYFIGKAGGMSFAELDESAAPKFTVKASTLNYIGDIHMPTLRTEVGNSIRKPLILIDIEISDNRKETLSALRLRYPDLAKRYPSVVGIALWPSN